EARKIFCISRCFCLKVLYIGNNNVCMLLICCNFLVVIWVSFCFNLVGLPLAVVVVAVIASVGTVNHHGPLYHNGSSDSSLLQVQMFLSVVAMVATTMTAIMHDRKQIKAELNQMNQSLEAQIV
ncbi:hypothetical protein L7F22_025397, partial [Adiantum nelumboides]|nr:hypothetical protein [Adiantum nelumboides]